MTNFDHLQALWQQQSSPDPPPAADVVRAKADQSHRQMMATHRSTMTTLSATVLLVSVYFWVYGSTANQQVLAGSSLMISSLLLRIGIEYVSYRLFGRIKLTTDLRTCLVRTRSFHRIRQGIQWGVTPISLGCYVWGFILLLPYIRAGVSEGFYWYILFSGSAFLLVLIVLIYRQVRNEMRLLTHLKASYATLLID